MRIMLFLMLAVIVGCVSVRQGLPYSANELELYFAATCDSERFDFGRTPPDWFGFCRASKQDLLELLRNISDRYAREYGESLLDGALADVVNKDTTMVFKGHVLYRKAAGNELNDCYYVVYPSQVTNVIDRIGAEYTNSVDYVEIEIPPDNPPSVFTTTYMRIDDEMMKALPRWRRIWFYTTHRQQ